jgi:hypothetical protein
MRHHPIGNDRIERDILRLRRDQGRCIPERPLSAGVVASRSQTLMRPQIRLTPSSAAPNRSGKTSVPSHCDQVWEHDSETTCWLILSQHVNH